jgi:hypothetical protein
VARQRLQSHLLRTHIQPRPRVVGELVAHSDVQRRVAVEAVTEVGVAVVVVENVLENICGCVLDAGCVSTGTADSKLTHSEELSTRRQYLCCCRATLRTSVSESEVVS